MVSLQGMLRLQAMREALLIAARPAAMEEPDGIAFSKKHPLSSRAKRDVSLRTERESRDPYTKKNRASRGASTRAGKSGPRSLSMTVEWVQLLRTRRYRRVTSALGLTTAGEKPPFSSNSGVPLAVAGSTQTSVLALEPCSLSDRA